jgi:hypothetical protein
VSRGVIVHPLLHVDVDEAAQWYDSREPGLGLEFEQELDLC